ncbi:AAA family ATPase [Parahaliea mediterranea]|uniref:AAA family ATPase n=1 Tax=Parahaliea mediterranea TaxID=651086 RepID=UPI000E2EC9AD|nr:AAA family ATPase [Parahaliea mediterranea]
MSNENCHPLDPEGYEEEKVHLDLVRKVHPQLMPLHVLRNAAAGRPWLIESLQPEGSLVLTYGAYGSGKSFYVLDKALHLACFENYLDRQVRTEGRHSIYIYGEGADGVAARVEAWCRHHGVAEDEILFAGYQGPVNLRQRADVDGILGAMSDARISPAHIVIDTLAVNAGAGFDENSAKDVGDLLLNLRYLQSKLVAPCSIELVHHTGKADAKTPRGHSALPAAMDAIFSIKPAKQGFTVSCVKQRDGDRGADMNFDLLPVDTSKTFLLMDMDTCQESQVEHKRESLVAIPRLPDSAAQTRNIMAGEKITAGRRAGIEVAKLLSDRYGDDSFPVAEFGALMAEGHGIVKQTASGVRRWLVDHGVLVSNPNGTLQPGPHINDIN